MKKSEKQTTLDGPARFKRSLKQEDEMDSEKKYNSTDPRLNEVLSSPAEYAKRLPRFKAEGLNTDSDCLKFAHEAHALSKPIGQAMDEYYLIEKKIFDAFEQGQRKGRATEHAKQFLCTPSQAVIEIERIKATPEHPYNNDKASDRLHNAAVREMELLIGIRDSGEAGYTDDCVNEILNESQKTLQDVTSSRSSSNGIEAADLLGTRYTPQTNTNSGKETKSGYGSRIEDGGGA